jgi:decaprenylphospho-beta-D-ribofuranose 2-oxidase
MPPAEPAARETGRAFEPGRGARQDSIAAPGSPDGRSGVAPVTVRATLNGWGRVRPAPAELVRIADVEALRAALPLGGARGLIARGMGRSYGDAAQRSDGVVLDMTPHAGFDLDDDSGIVSAASGVTLGELLRFSVPRGWMVPVLPGTQHVTVGGAIASDIHGKNHGASGTFGTYAEALGLLMANGDLVELTWRDELFRATVGGMGLTGVIVWARIALRPISSPLLAVDTDRVAGLDEALAALTAPGGPYRVAWLDLLSAAPARGVVTRADHFDGDRDRAAVAGSPTVRARLSVPRRWPGGLLQPSTVRAFNELRFRRSPRRERGRLEAIGRHMFPLDALSEWPRLYGRHGFVQYQPVVPLDREDVLRTMIVSLRRSGVPCYLCVLKDFGPANAAPLSFPILGWTIALDLPRAAPGLDALLDSFDELVVAAGGRVYLSKDVRMRAETVTAMYPRLEEWRAIRDGSDPEGVWRSDLAVRTGLVG